MGIIVPTMGGDSDIDYQNPVLLKQGTDNSIHGASEGFLITVLNMTKAETKEIASKYKRLIAYQECPLFQTGNKYDAWRIASIYDLTVVKEEYLSMYDYPIFDLESYTWPLTHRNGNLKIVPKFQLMNYREYSTADSYDRVFADREILIDNADSKYNSLTIAYDGSSTLKIGFTQNLMPNSSVATPIRTYRVYGVE